MQWEVWGIKDGKKGKVKVEAASEAEARAKAERGKVQVTDIRPLDAGSAPRPAVAAPPPVRKPAPTRPPSVVRPAPEAVEEQSGLDELADLEPAAAPLPRLAPLPGTGIPPVPQYSVPAYAPPGGGQRTNGWAIASLVCGIVVCTPITALSAIVCGILGILKARDPQYGGKTMAIVGTSLGGAGLFMSVLSISILLPSLNRARETANRIKCASNERQIAKGILLYENDTHGDYPPDLGTLIVKEDMTATTFVCPSAPSEVPSNIKNGSPAEQAAWVNANSDYIYVGAGLTQRTASQSTLVLYEKPADHQDGVNMMFGDGHVEFLRMTQANTIIQQAVHTGQ